jgi:hypothetical protein
VTITTEAIITMATALKPLATTRKTTTTTTNFLVEIP